MMLTDPSKKYRPAYQRVDLPDRTWPNNTISKAPIWMSTDLRDGNQALFEPMNAEQKLRMFKTLVAIGFKEIEVAFPSASQTDFDFVRGLIENNLIPDDVTIEVLTQARDHLIERTMESVRGAKKVIVHVYNATSPVFRQTVFNLDQAETKALAIHAAKRSKRLQRGTLGHSGLSNIAQRRLLRQNYPLPKRSVMRLQKSGRQAVPTK